MNGPKQMSLPRRMRASTRTLAGHVRGPVPDGGVGGAGQKAPAVRNLSRWLIHSSVRVRYFAQYTGSTWTDSSVMNADNKQVAHQTRRRLGELLVRNLGSRRSSVLPFESAVSCESFSRRIPR